ncbi:hypothetical protein [Caulobacter vibrioides]|uniref:hypothetical protein n=1 Tax=Caulobacter vibrioides TaxID=155892 RepID=UPI000F744916|nr:hypothetical protein [Caulobacter vibrioides]
MDIVTRAQVAFKSTFGPFGNHLPALKALRGEIYGYIHENASAGMARGLYWNIFVELAPLKFDGEVWDCAILADWLSLTIQNVHELDGVTWDSVREKELVEGSFYLAEHHPARVDELTICRASEPSALTVSLRGEFEFCWNLKSQNVPFDIQCPLELRGILVTPEGLDPKPLGSDDVRATVSQFISTIGLDAPIQNGSQYVMAPETSEPVSR